jgi:hypothetical protein
MQISKAVSYLISLKSVGEFVGFVENYVNGLMQSGLYYK